MKKLIPILLILSVKMTVAQISNGSFENWDTVFTNIYSIELANQYGVPNPLGGTADGWTSDNNFGTSRTTDSYTGNYSLIIHNCYSYVYQTIFYNDTCGSSPLFVQGFYKYINGSTNGPSQGNAKVTLTHFNGIANDTVATGTYTFDSTATFTPFQIPINYISFLPPDSIHINILNGNTLCTGGDVCNLLYLDNLTLSNTPLAIERTTNLNDLVVVYPNPSNNELSIQNNSCESIQFTMYNSLGEKLLDKILLNKINTLYISDYACGIYLYKVSLCNNATSTGRIIKQ